MNEESSTPNFQAGPSANPRMLVAFVGAVIAGGMVFVIVLGGASLALRADMIGPLVWLLSAGIASALMFYVMFGLARRAERRHGGRFAPTEEL